MTTTDLVEAPSPVVSLFPGATAADVIDAASDVSRRFYAIVREQRMYKRIGDHDHIQIEAWQTIGALTGVFAVEADGVTELPWPTLGPTYEPPPTPGREPRDKNSPAWREWATVDKAFRRWELHNDLVANRSLGRSFGFRASFRAVRAGVVIGWGQGQCDRGEANWTNDEDFELSSMAQTRGQSRTLSAPLRFVVKLAGFEAEDDEGRDGAGGSPELAKRVAELEAELETARAAALTWADDESMESAAKAVQKIRHDVDGFRFVLRLGQAFKEGVPEPAARALRVFAWFLDQPDATGSVRAQEAADGPSEATPAAEADAEVVDAEVEPENAPPDPSVSTYHQGPAPASPAEESAP